MNFKIIKRLNFINKFIQKIKIMHNNDLNFKKFIFWFNYKYSINIDIGPDTKSIIK